ncbi:MAG TPA: hypothetical protein VMG12_19775 [Polyangiaceae bacterium]|nr:hypothetical protein [Polyangiaceae bacterium]
MSKQGIRIIPKLEEPLAPLTRMATERGWHLKKAVGRSAAEQTDGEYIFHLPKADVFIVLRDDLLPGVKFYAVLGQANERVAKFLRREIEHWTEPELFSWWDRAVESGDVDDKTDAVLYLGINTSEVPTDDYIKRIMAALSDPDKAVRNAAVVAAAYADWRVFRDALKRIAESDPDEKARERASFVLNGWNAEDGRA